MSERVPPSLRKTAARRLAAFERAMLDRAWILTGLEDAADGDAMDAVAVEAEREGIEVVELDSRVLLLREQGALVGAIIEVEGERVVLAPVRPVG